MKELEKLDREILDLLGERALSPSHDKWHTDRVLQFAIQLQEKYGGDLEVLVAAARLHDLGRDDPRKRGIASIQDSVKQSRRLLSQTDMSEDQINSVLDAIDQHDQPDISPTSLEGRILKDADFLAGFGAWGILRISMWVGETGEGVPQVRRRLLTRMPERLRSLEFPESRECASKQMLLVHYFLDSLDEPPRLERARRGTYVVFEGVSGSGKDTQIELLEAELKVKGIEPVLIREPSDLYREVRDCYKCKAAELNKLSRAELMFLLLATRYRLVMSKIKPALEGGQFVLGNRSFLSTLVYQGNPDFCGSIIALFHHFVPMPDLVLLFDVEPELAYKRLCQSRGADNLSEHESLSALIQHRPLYREYAERLFSEDLLVRIDAGQSVAEVRSQVADAVRCVLKEHGTQ